MRKTAGECIYLEHVNIAVCVHIHIGVYSKETDDTILYIDYLLPLVILLYSILFYSVLSSDGPSR